MTQEELLADALHWALNQLNPNRPNADRIKALANEVVRLREELNKKTQEG